MNLVNHDQKTITPPIHLIPVEVLEDIFIWLSLTDAIGDLETYMDYDEAGAELSDSESSDEGIGYAASDTDSDYSYVSVSDLPLRLSWGFARVTHVCRLWRAIALALPSLWSTLPTHLPLQWLEELVRRSGEAPLDVIGADRTYLGLTVLLGKCASRIRSIEAEPHCEDWWYTDFISAQKYPAVTELSVYGTLEEHDMTLAELLSRVPPLTILRVEMTFLCALPPSHLTINLTELSIERGPYMYPNKWLPVDHFMAFITGIPRIETLHLAGCLPAMDTSTAVLLSRIELPRLRHITLIETGNQTAISVFLDSVHLAASTTVDVVCQVKAYEPEEVPATPDPATGPKQLGLDSLFLHGRPVSPIHTLAIVQGSGPRQGIYLHGWRDVGFRADGSPNFRMSDTFNPHPLDDSFTTRSTNAGDVAIQYQCQFDWECIQSRTFFERPKDVFANICVLSLLLKGPPSSAIKSIHGGVSSFLSAAYRVEHLRLAAFSPSPKHSAAAAMLPALCELDEGAPAKNASHWKVMPALKTLTIQNMSAHTKTDVGATVLDALRQVISTRMANGGVLHTVYIHNWMCRDDDTAWRKGMASVNIHVTYGTSMHTL